MAKHSTNYVNSFIRIAPDCRATMGKVPPKPDSVAGLQYAMITAAPYRYTSDDVLVAVTATRRDLSAAAHQGLRAELFAKGQPCLRCSPLVKTYGWGVHHDENGSVALIGCETDQYAALSADTSITQVMGMRTSRS